MECRGCEWLRFRQVMMFGTIQPGIAPEILFETLLTCLKKIRLKQYRFALEILVEILHGTRDS